VIADEAVEMEFGTGALGVTPAHSMTDWEIADRHNLPRPQVINEYAKMTVGDERIIGKKTTEARETIVEWLRTEGLLEKEEDVKQNISTAERTGGIVEPLPKLQWFVNVNKSFILPHSTISGIESGSETTLKDIMKKSVENGQIKILPDHFQKTYFSWINNLRDWCISRQIWYGHRIPVWYKDSEIFIGDTAPDDNWKQDEDTLDTWFSSGLWTFSTLGWPEQTNDLQTYHPTSVLETGNDILFFWVARMILMSKYLLNTVPFKTVYLHGMVRDEKGRKMSKSLGNIVNPVDLIEKYGTDALRMAMIVGVGPGSDSNLGEEKIKAYSKFANKIWNATRFVMEQTHDLDINSTPEYDAEDQQSIDELNAFIKEITPEMQDYKFYLVSEKLYHYLWDTFASVIIERSKIKITETNSVSAKWVLYTHLITLIKALHPFMPFITEEIWSMLPKTEHGTKNRDILMVSVWPE
jgi:valyl-tRNA synthetase